MMHAVDLIASALDDDEKYPLPVEPEPGLCCVTGDNTMTIPRRKLLGSSFMDLNLLAAPESSRVGVNAWYAMQYGAAGLNADGSLKKRRKKPEMQACWIVSPGHFQVIAKPEIRRFVLSGYHYPPWAGWITTSYKKHGSLRAPVNGDIYGIWGFDDVLADASNIGQVLDWWIRLRHAQDSGIGRKAIETGEISPSLIVKAGVDTWERFDQWAHNKRQAPLYRLLAYLLPSQAELKDGFRDEQYL